MKKSKNITLEEELQRLVDQSRTTSSMTVNEILESLTGKGPALLLVFLVLPFCQPIQIPGMSIPFGILISFLGLRISFGRRVWLPKSILSKKISAEHVQNLAEKTLNWLNKMRRFVHPRMNWICAPAVMQTVNGLLIFALGIFLAIPFPIPLTNILAGWSILLVSLGFLENDGLLVFLGYLITLITFVFLVFIIIQITHVFSAIILDK